MNTLEKWIATYSKPIERFAFQNGCTPEQAALVAGEAFKGINEDSDQPFIYALYKNVINVLANIERTVELPKGTFPFEEDAELHLEIIKLDEDYRVPLILNLFHKLEVEEIAFILNSSETEVKAKIGDAKELLTGGNLEKRLGFLRNSYDRRPVLFNSKNEIGEPMSAVSTLKIHEQKMKNSKGTLTAAILGVLLISLLVGTYFTGEEWRHKSDQKYIENIKTDFAAELSKKQEILGVSGEVVRSIPFIEEVNEQFDKLTQDLDKKIEENERIDRNNAKEQLSNLSVSMKLPSELADDLFKSPLTADAEKSTEFINEYFEKLFQIQNSIYDQFSQEFDQLNVGTADVKYDFDLILSNEKDYSEGLRMGVHALVSQNVNPNWWFSLEKGPIDLKNGNFYERIEAGLNESAIGYMLFYAKQPFIIDFKLIYSLDDNVGFIEKMEKTLHADSGNVELREYLESTMIRLLSSIVFGESEEPLWNSSGSISEVYRNAWKRLASFENDSVVSEVMTKVVDEMEQSDWTQSEFFLTLQDYETFEAFFLIK